MGAPGVLGTRWEHEANTLPQTPKHKLAGHVLLERVAHTLRIPWKVFIWQFARALLFATLQAQWHCVVVRCAVLGCIFLSIVYFCVLLCPWWSCLLSLSSVLLCLCSGSSLVHIFSTIT